MQGGDQMKEVTGLHIFVSGIVQGVGFREYTRNQAIKENVTGIARNLDDGRVEILLYGTDIHIERVKEALHTGPPASDVEDLQSEELYDTPLKGFSVE